MQGVVIMSSKLVKIGIYGAVASVSSCAIMYYLLQRKLASSGYYTNAVKVLKQSEKAMYLLGEPLRFQMLKLNDRRNYITTTNAQVYIPVSGSKSAGFINSTSIHKDGQWLLQSVTLEFKGRQDKLIIIDDHTIAKNHNIES